MLLICKTIFSNFSLLFQCYVSSHHGQWEIVELMVTSLPFNLVLVQLSF